MSLISELVERELIESNKSVQSVTQFFKESSHFLLDKGYVKESFFEAINEREKKYPTGLQLENLSVAIPHTDTNYVLFPFIYIAKISKKNISFIQMGTSDIKVYPKYIIILGITDPKAQVKLLSSLMELFSNEQFVSDLENCNNEEEIYNLLNKY